ncbi:MAG: dihydroorotate dehydrogenase electron transfer subunit [Lachnospiraceae bacterium]|jgi:dihydroorotate dehydrogenase electron transfer subunit
MASYLNKAKVVSQISLTEGVYSLTLSEPEIARDALPGQFAMLYPADGARLLGRPVSICGADPRSGTVRFVYRVAGRGTAEFSALAEGDSLAVMGPLGNGYPLEKTGEGTVLLLGGGIGLPPLLFLAESLRGRPVTAVLGYRDCRDFMAEEFRAVCGRVVETADDGSLEIAGNVLDAVRQKNLSADVICACGPTPMLRAVKAYAESAGIPAYLSLEQRMACGVGACLGCVVRTVRTDSHSHVNNARVCKDGPVFLSTEVIL